MKHNVQQVDVPTLRAALICPRCRNAVHAKDGNIVCGTCGYAATVQKGVISFLGTDNADYLAEVDGIGTAELQEFISIMRSGSPSQAEQNIRQRFPVFGDYLFRPGRADWRFYVARTGAERVLDVGAGWGNLAFEFAKDGHEVMAIDASLSKMQFLAARAEMEKVSTISCINADFLDGIAIKDESVDIGILNGVLEWAGTFRATGRPADHQRNLLKEIARVLRPDGSLYIGIENRYGYQYFLGEPDDHTRLRWTNLVPRWVADLRMYYKTGHGYRTYTYSAHALCRLLHRSGFRNVTFLWPHFNYKYYNALIPLAPEPVNWYMQQANVFEPLPLRWAAKDLLLHLSKPSQFKKKFRALLEAVFVSYPRVFLPVVPSFSVIARK